MAIMMTIQGLFDAWLALCKRGVQDHHAHKLEMIHQAFGSFNPMKNATSADSLHLLVWIAGPGMVQGADAQAVSLRVALLAWPQHL